MRERPEPGWHAAGWSWLRRWWATRHPGQAGQDLDADEPEAAPDTPDAPAPRRWRRVARAVVLWCVGTGALALLAVAAVDPGAADRFAARATPWVAVVGAACAVTALAVSRAARRRAAHTAHWIARRSAYRTARAQRQARQARNRAAWAAAQAERDAAAARARQARRERNRNQRGQS